MQASAQDAQEAATPSAQASGDVVYDQAYFAQYDPQNALDMLRRIPGVSSVLASQGRGSQQRGFGSGGGDQIILNGRRFPGKSNDISKALGRLRADNVERIELIRGGRPDIDVQSTGLIVNVVLMEGASLAGGGTFEIAGRANDEGDLGVDGLATYTGSTGSLAYNVGIERSILGSDMGGGGGGGGFGSYFYRFRDEVYFYPDGIIQEARPQTFDRDYDKRAVNGGLTYDLAGGARAQVNGLFETSDTKETIIVDVTEFDRSGNVTDVSTERQLRLNDDQRLIEISGEFTAPLWGGDLTILLLGNQRKQPSFNDRVSIAGGTTSELSRSSTDLKRSELIGRVRYGFPLSDQVSVSFGGEGAKNTLKQFLRSSFDTNGDGKVEPIVIPTADARVKEIRGEAFSEVKWNPSAALSTTGSLNYEYSKLSTNSIFNAGRTLAFFKPRLDVRYSPTSAGTASFLVERTISQLNFNNFVPRYNFRDNRIDAGNPGLLPEKVWNFELGYEHRLPNDLGVLSGKAFYRDITDAIDAFPLLQGAVLVSAQGNLGPATRKGLELQASIRLLPLGIRGAVLTVRSEFEKTSVVDPFTGEKRRLSFDSGHDYTVNFRHDVAALDGSYGFEYQDRGRERLQSDLFSVDFTRQAKSLSFFAEKRLTSNLQLRADVDNVLKNVEVRNRNIFAINQIDGTIRRLESYRDKRDRRYALTLKGSF